MWSMFWYVHFAGAVGKAEGVPSHRLQHVLAQHALVAADHVGDGVVAHVTHVQRTGRVRQHGKAIILLAGRVFLHLVGALLVPEALRAFFHGGRVVTPGFAGRLVSVVLHGYPYR